MINIGVIGYGYWGPNLARNFHANPELNLATICDASADRLELASRLYPQTRFTTDVDYLFEDSSLDALAISTPVSTHYPLAKKALLAHKHLWLEKPMTETTEQAEELIDLALEKDRVLLVDHTFVYTGAVRKIKELVAGGQLGDLIYYDSTRVNLGLFQQDVNVIWDLAPHDIAIMDHLIPLKKLRVSATGSDYYGNSIVPKSLLTVYMENHVVAHINVSWISPVKIRQTLIGGTAKMVVYDDTQPSDKIKIYDKGVEFNETKEALYRMKVQYRVGDMYAPKVDDREALATLTEHFADCVLRGAQPITGGQAGLEVVKVLTASEESLKKNGAPVDIH